MSQLSIFDELITSTDIEVTRAVLLHGAFAGPRHAPVELRTGGRDAHVVPVATAVQMLDLAESALRYNQAGHARLDVTKRGQAGSNGPMGRDDLTTDRKGIHGRTGSESVTWSRLLDALRRQRVAEPEIARLRDLAAAYHLLDYYGAVYERQPVSGEWRADRFVESIARDVIDLGGDPTQLDAHTEYMAVGVAAAML